MPYGRVAVVDEEAVPPVVVIRYDTPEQAEWYIGYLYDHGGKVTRAKIERGGYGIDVPEDMQKWTAEETGITIEKRYKK